jgi:hypothetical protein
VGGSVTGPPGPSWSYRPLQSLVRQRCSRLTGYLLPVRSSRSRKRPILPVFLPLSMPKEATPWAILSWGSALLHGLSRSPAHGISTMGTSLGVSCPYSARGSQSPRPARCQTSSPVVRDSAHRSHPAGYGAARRFSQPLSGFLLQPPPCHFQTGGAPGIRPPGDCSSHAASTARHRRNALLTFLPPDALAPPSRGSEGRA